MRTGFIAMVIGITAALTLKNEKNLTSQVVTISLVSELLTILISGLVEIS